MLRRMGASALFMLLFAVVLASFASMILWELKSRFEATEADTNAIAYSFLEIESAIGYVGLIHHFKNAVLRPTEPKYMELADQAYVAALVEIERLEALLIKADILVDVSAFRETINAYGKALDKVRTAHARGYSPSEVDRLVRIDDEAAKADLEALQHEIKMLLEKRRQAASRMLTAGLFAFVMLISLLIAAFAIWRVRSLRQRRLRGDYRRQQEELQHD